MEKNKLLFVCLGNICRSPAAEGVMKALVQQSGRENEFEIDSAGIGGWHIGQLPDERMRKRGSLRGYNFNSHARQFQIEDFDKFDKILIMDHDNYKALKAKAPNDEALSKVEMLADYMTSHPNQDIIPDPYYGGISDFDYALDLIEDACESLLKSYAK
ncbi:low molecular weight protein-tyrosine-phosphatase [Hoylesella nanceiensis]